MKTLCKVILLLIGAVSVLTNAAQIQPTDLIDEALEQVEQLKSIVKGEIATGHSSLNSIVSEFRRNSAQVSTAGTFALKQIRDIVYSKLNTIKNLAHSAGKDPSICTDEPEETLNNLQRGYAEQMSSCLTVVNNQARDLSESSKYVVDVVFITATHLEFQIKQCKGDLLCISPILNQIELDKIKLPQKIKTEVQTCERTVSLLKLSANSCSNDNVSPYATEAHSILDEIEVCVNAIIGQK